MSNEEKYHFEATNGGLGEPKILILENGEVGGEIVGEVTASQAVVAYADHNEWATPKEIFGWLTDIAIDIAKTQELREKESYVVQIKDVDEQGNLISDYENLKQKRMK